MSARSGAPSFPMAAIAVGIVALIGAGFMQHHVEERRIESKLSWMNSEDKDSLEVGFLALGGFRGLLADVLWFKAQTQQDSSHYYELKLLCDLIQKLQPTFTHVHAFQAYNMSYNISIHAENCEDKWYWIRSGLATLENGLERTRQNYNLWFELGYQYFDRLSDQKIENCRDVRDRELPNIDELTDEQIESAFSKPGKWVPGHARKDENYRFAAYFFWKSIATQTEKNPLRTERIYGQCLEHLGMWYAKDNKPVSEWKKWSDGGTEAWYVELLRRNKERDMTWDQTVPELLRGCMQQQIYTYATHAQEGSRQGNFAYAAQEQKKADEAYARMQQYLPEDKATIEEIVKKYGELIDRQRHFGLRP